ncbi:molybdenum cofactor guanylyltransferase [Lentibacillus sp. Marseille-P4043]|uniref:molybdenum cofactor guanylyltransferase n=1 Tax=Lentibacillus sp. Marseille-P4043 TaxID=2040293 RepID=UPI000D0B59C9|nr:molybdenum cofactor guanylyltransferase [Lentibacillus sp. Marseille-P4043]
MKSCGVILSGGKSTRMGKNKSLLPLQNKPVIEHVAEELMKCSDEVVVVTNEPSAYKFLHVPLIEDRYVNKGPLAGLDTALYHQEADIFLIAACDMPFINQYVYAYLIDQLNQYDAVVPIFENQMHPLAGIYRKSVLPTIQHQLMNDNRKVRGILDHIQVNYVHHFATISAEILTKHFFNMNYPMQYDQAKKV